MTYDENSMEPIWSWEVIKKDVPCLAQSFVNGGIKGGGTIERFDTDEYKSTDYVRFKTKRPLSKSQRITNIRSRMTKEPVWIEEELDLSPTIFNVDGCAPTTNPFTGEAEEFVSTLSRAQTQRMD